MTPALHLTRAALEAATGGPVPAGAPLAALEARRVILAARRAQHVVVCGLDDELAREALSEAA